MSFLLDTNVLSELARPHCEPQVERWMSAIDEDETFISVISIAELRQGYPALLRESFQHQLDHQRHVFGNFAKARHFEFDHIQSIK